MTTTATSRTGEPAEPPDRSGGDPAAVTMTHRQILVVIVGLMLAMLLAALDQTIVSTALPRIVSDLGGLSHYSWVVTAYLVASTATTPLYGKVSDLYGRKRTFQVAILIFLLGSVLCGASQNIAQLVAFRALQGLGGGGLIALSMAVIGDIVPPRQRGRYQGYFGAVFAASSVVGPLAGGFFTDQATWRWIFYLNLPLGALAFVVLATVLKLPARRTEHRIDYEGAALVVAGVVSILLVTEWGGRTYAWTSAPILSLSVVGVVLLVAFVWWEARAAEPILPLRLFRRSIFSVASALSLISGLTLFGAVIFLPQYLQVVKGASATRSGLELMPLTLGIVTASIVSGRRISHTGRYKPYPIAGTLVLTFGFYLLSRLEVDTSLLLLSLWTLVIGAGIGLFMQVTVLAVQNDADPGDMGTATGAVTFFRTLGGSFGTAIFGAVLTNRLAFNLPRLLPPGTKTRGVDVSQAAGSVTAIKRLPPPIHSAVLEAFVRSFHVIYLTAIPFGLCALLLAFLLKERPLRDVAGGTHARAEPAAQPAGPAGASQR